MRGRISSERVLEVCSAPPLGVRQNWDAIVYTTLGVICLVPTPPTPIVKHGSVTYPSQLSFGIGPGVGGLQTSHTQHSHCEARTTLLGKPRGEQSRILQLGVGCGFVCQLESVSSSLSATTAAQDKYPSLILA